MDNSGAGGKESACQCRRHRFDPWLGKIPWNRKWRPTPVLLSGKSPRQRSLVGYSPWGRKELDTTERLSMHTHTHTHTHTHQNITLHVRTSQTTLLYQANSQIMEALHLIFFLAHTKSIERKDSFFFKSLSPFYSSIISLKCHLGRTGGQCKGSPALQPVCDTHHVRLELIGQNWYHGSA